MSKGQSELTDQVTLLVFKDNLAARTFQIPLGWITRFGLLIGSLIVLAVLCSITSIRYYRVAHRSDPARVQDLEQELSELKLAYKAIEAKSLTPPAPVGPIGQASTQPSAAPAPVVSPTERASAMSGESLVFSALPAGFQAPPANPASIPITMNAPEAAWHGRTLRVKFNIQYVLEDKGNQQGRIILLARGPDTLLAYPNGVLNPPGSAALIAPERGEYFSVSRFRETRAEFANIRAQDAVTDVEVLLVSQSGQILIYERIKAKGASPARAPKPAGPAPVTTAPAVETPAPPAEAPKGESP